MSRTAQILADGEHRSVFRPTKEQEPVCMAAKERRGNVARSEWALLDTLEVQMVLDERDQKHRTLRANQAAQAQHLEAQMRQEQAKKAALEAGKVGERQYADSIAAKHQEDERRAREQARAAQVKVKQDRERSMSEARARELAQRQARHAEEQALVAAAQAQLEADKAAQAARVAAERATMERTMAENAVRLAARKEAERQQRQVDEELMKQTLQTLERQDREREAAAVAFQNMIQARANKASTKAVEDHRARLEREERQMRDALALAERREAERAAAEEAKRAKQKADVVAFQSEHARIKAEREAAARAEAQRERELAAARTAAEVEADARKMAALRERCTDTKRFVAGQMDTTARRAKVDDVFMTEEERKINRRLLERAQAVVGEPKQYSVRLM